MAHFAVTDVARQRFRFAQKLSRGALGLAGASAAPLRVWVDDWQLHAAPGTRATLAALAAQEGYAIELELEPRVRRCLNGEAGFSAKSAQAGDASYYYSLPRLAVHGRLLRDGRAAGRCRASPGSTASGAAADSGRKRWDGTGSRCS